MITTHHNLKCSTTHAVDVVSSNATSPRFDDPCGGHCVTTDPGPMRLTHVCQHHGPWHLKGDLPRHGLWH